MKQLFFIMSIMCGLYSCQLRPQKTEQVSTIDNTLQTKVNSILENKLSGFNALLGQTIIMKVQTRQIKALVRFKRKDIAFFFNKYKFPANSELMVGDTFRQIIDYMN